MLSAGNEETVKEIKDAGGKAYGYVVDVSSRASIYEAADTVKTEIGKVEILINNAGIVSGRKLLDIPDHLIEKTMQVNTMSNFWVSCMHVACHMYANEKMGQICS
jgi:all-trans-retinol dehydrogenase (NAD+)